MTHKTKTSHSQFTLLVDNEVIRQIRQHARSCNRTEICGVLIGREHEEVVEVEASIVGQNAEEAGAHVTFTQDTWEHIYRIKDKEYPDLRIVGWYHSHPGFGVFLSDHDIFIHKNFFSSPGQVAWVFDPHSDEEGCFGWVNGRIERLSRLAIVDRQGGQVKNRGREASAIIPRDLLNYEKEGEATDASEASDTVSLQRLTVNLFLYLSVFLLGFLLSWYFFPRTELMPVPVDPQTGRMLVPSGADSERGENPRAQGSETTQKADPNASAAGQASNPGDHRKEGDNGRPKR